MFPYVLSCLLALIFLSGCTPSGGLENNRYKTIPIKGQQSDEDITPISSGLKEIEEEKALPKEIYEENEPIVESEEVVDDYGEDEDDEIPDIVTPQVEPQTPQVEPQAPQPESPTPQDEGSSDSENTPPIDTAPIPEVVPEPTPTPEPSPMPEDISEEEVDVEEAPGTSKLDEMKSLLAEFSRFAPRFRLALTGRDQADFFNRDKSDLALTEDKEAIHFPKNGTQIRFKKNEAEKIKDDYTILAVVRTKKTANAETIARLILTGKSTAADKDEKAKEKEEKKAAKEKEKEEKEKEKEEKRAAKEKEKANAEALTRAASSVAQIAKLEVSTAREIVTPVVAVLDEKAKEKEKEEKAKKQKKHNLNIEILVQKLKPVVRITEKEDGKKKKPIVLKPKFKLDPKKWHLITVSIVDNQVHLYSGDKLLAKEKISFDHFDYKRTQLWIGARNKAGKNLWSGEIAELHLYDGVPAIFRGE